MITIPTRNNLKAKEYIKVDKYLNAKYYYKDPAMTILHREDGPAVEYITGDKQWYRNGVHHRMDGPAKDYVKGFKAWYVNDDTLARGELLSRMN